MALQVSSRVIKNTAAQICLGMENDTSSGSYSRLVIAFIRNDVPIPTNSSEIYNYLNTSLNHSNYGGAMTTNEGYVLAAYTFPDLNVYLQFGQLSSDPKVVSYVGPTSITAKQTGTVGSIIVYAPNQNTGGYGYAYVGNPLANTSTGANMTNTVMPTGISSSTYNAYAPQWFKGFSFCTDSVGGTDSSASVKLSTLDLVQGQSFTFHSIGVKLSSFN